MGLTQFSTLLTASITGKGAVTASLSLASNWERKKQHVLEGRAAIQIYNLGHGLSSIIYICKGSTPGTQQLCAAGWAELDSRSAEKSWRSWWTRLNMDQSEFLWFSEIKMCCRDLRKDRIIMLGKFIVHVN